MLKKQKEKEPLKKVVYLLLSILLGVMLSFIAHAGLEIYYIKYLEDNNLEIIPHYFFGNTTWCALPIWVQAGLLILGIVGGFLMGLTWWKWVYVDRKHRKFRKK